ncbi:nuclear transport factor 2 family protein [Paeniglutamicibacter terrestris]|uniref:Nuclear transport factor 2 family protein n=1 Tax=Paeniglutamicibacter terrestris TaxID=2723403 RepID=A0ABX1G2R1_9MICC|nr:nuclear transport factor 2 family protein [Paeniglutamicibacter terrestris]NKG19865.1 nuclear transport factor 2 family protein [Paeniglutamicibacter terrestris]
MINENFFPAVASYFDLMEGSDKTEVLSVFDPNAVVIDDGHGYTGHREILDWLTGPASEFTITKTLISSSRSAQGAIANIRVDGNFPGSPVDLRHEFTQGSTGLIGSLTISV